MPKPITLNIAQDGGSSIWNVDRTILIKKLLEAVKLNEAYQRCFHDVKVRFLIGEKLLSTQIVVTINRKNCKKLPMKNNLISLKCTSLESLTLSAKEFRKSLICSISSINFLCSRPSELKAWILLLRDLTTSSEPCSENPTKFWTTVNWYYFPSKELFQSHLSR